MLKEKRYVSFVDLEKAFDRVPRKVLEWAMRKKGIPTVLVTRELEWIMSCLVKMGMYQRSVLSPFFAVVVDVVTEFTRGCAK